MSESTTEPKTGVSLLRAAGFVLAAAGVAAVFSPLVTGPWRMAGLSSTDAGLAVAATGLLLLIAAAVRRGILRRG
ncbi:MAG: hypothetical protein P0Y56_06665 [Candidatus Andeanibacterium colombiense]|uniref:Uncharacterized protein n=1 Tax=Candidatus Andeanibacterium colombiense TaxID=3121345 RepID=A0AAJ5X8P4_9SPHN|nr:MAG: hypothetical protein P0Y56_06665 [Sphingomonadaceae bacterium]